MHQRILSIPRVSGRPRAALGRTGCSEIHTDGPAGRRQLGAGGLTPSGASATGHARSSQVALGRAWGGIKGGGAARSASARGPGPLEADPGPSRSSRPFGVPCIPKGCPSGERPFPALRRPQERRGGAERAKRALASQRGPTGVLRAPRGLHGSTRLRRRGRRLRSAREGGHGRASSGEARRGEKGGRK